MSYQPDSIVGLLSRYPSLFYRQVWYSDERFVRILPVETIASPPTALLSRGHTPNPKARLPYAVDLLNCYVQHPTAPIWDEYLWTADTDAQGQRVYVGGCANGKGLEIHRHLHLTERWGIPAWR